MSGLAALLAGERPAGVYRWDDATPSDDVRRAVEEAGARFGHVDGHVRPGKEGLLAQVAEQLAFPDWFGHNFDALADCLADLDAPTVLLWDGWGALAHEEPQTFVIGVDVLGTRAAGPPPFAVLLRGEGPEIDPPWLVG